MTFCSALWDVLLALVGAAIGTYMGVFVSNRQFAKTEKERKIEVLNGLAESLAFNSNRSGNLLNEFRNNQKIATFRFDTASLHGWIMRSHGVLTKELLEELNWHWYQLDHINQKLSIVTSRLIETDYSDSDKAALSSAIGDLLLHNKVVLEGGYKWSERVSLEALKIKTEERKN